MFNKDSLDPIYQWSALTNTMLQRVGACASESINDCLSMSNKHMMAMGSAKTLEEFMALSGELGPGCSAAYLKCSQRMLDTAMENFNDLSRWFESHSKHMQPIWSAVSPTQQQPPHQPASSNKSK